MLELSLQPNKYWDEINNQFIQFEGGTFHLEHNLKAIFEWEGLHCKPFYGFGERNKKTVDEIVDYVRCMTKEKIDNNTAFIILSTYSEQITSYINKPQTATVIKRTSRGDGSEGLSAELLYYYIGQAQVPIECENWHISRLMTILEIAGEKSKPPKMMSQASIMRSNAALNRARRAGRPG